MATEKNKKGHEQQKSLGEFFRFFFFDFVCFPVIEVSGKEHWA